MSQMLNVFKMARLELGGAGSGRAQGEREKTCSLIMKKREVVGKTRILALAARCSGLEGVKQMGRVALSC